MTPSPIRHLANPKVGRATPSRLYYLDHGPWTSFPIIMLSLKSVWPFLVFDVVTLTELDRSVRPL